MWLSWCKYLCISNKYVQTSIGPLMVTQRLDNVCFGELDWLWRLLSLLCICCLLKHTQHTYFSWIIVEYPLCLTTEISTQEDLKIQYTDHNGFPPSFHLTFCPSMSCWWTYLQIFFPWVKLYSSDSLTIRELTTLTQMVELSSSDYRPIQVHLLHKGRVPILTPRKMQKPGIADCSVNP